MDDANIVAAIASDYIRGQGRGAVDHLRDQQRIAEGIGDALSAGAWQEIADAAEEMLLQSN